MQQQCLQFAKRRWSAPCNGRAASRRIGIGRSQLENVSQVRHCARTLTDSDNCTGSSIPCCLPAAATAFDLRLQVAITMSIALSCLKWCHTVIHRFKRKSSLSNFEKQQTLRRTQGRIQGLFPFATPSQAARHQARKRSTPRSSRARHSVGIAVGVAIGIGMGMDTCKAVGTAEGVAVGIAVGIGMGIMMIGREAEVLVVAKRAEEGRSRQTSRKEGVRQNNTRGHPCLQLAEEARSIPVQCRSIE